MRPADQKVVVYLYSADLSLALREHQRLLYLSSQTQQIKAVISSDDEGIFGGKETSQSLLFYGGNTGDDKL